MFLNECGKQDKEEPSEKKEEPATAAEVEVNLPAGQAGKEPTGDIAK
ncbi:MAG: hypothetical protein AABY93_12005 [Bacteroidota bacterium]